tara:strand:+ start:39 stop:902 length:864 start_codon:yes stop_codon:yes gene_type:complete
MAKRIGKYKVSKREEALSAIDGGTVSGNLDGIGTLETSGAITAGGALGVTGLTTVTGGITTGIKADYSPTGLVNDMHISGLNPTWAVNFGGILAGQSDCSENVLTNANTMLQMSYALEGIARQTAVVSAAQASAIFGGTGVTGVDYTVAAGTPASANLKVVRLKGNYDDVALTIPDLASDKHQTLFIFTDNVVTAGGVLSFQMNVANEFDAESSENFTSTDGGTVMTRATALTDAHNQLILTDTGASTMLAGSFIYFQANNNTDVMTVKSCIRTSGGTIAITEANND